MPPGFKLQHQSDTEDSSESSASDSERETPTGSQYTAPDSRSEWQAPKQGSSGESEDDETIGPLPGQGPQNDMSKAEEFERRAQKMKDKLLNKVCDILSFKIQILSAIFSRRYQPQYGIDRIFF